MINKSKSEEYIKNVLKKQAKLIELDVIYGDGSIHNFDYKGFCKLYYEVINEINISFYYEN